MVKKHKEPKLTQKEKIIKYLLENKDPQSIKSISRATLIDYKNTYSIINEITSKIINQKKIGNTNLISLNLVPNQGIYAVENKRTEEVLTKNPKIKLIQEDIKEINYPFMIVLIFGSYAKEKNTSSSDIDFCIISDNNKKTKELNEKLNLHTLKLEIQEFTTKEFTSMLEKKQNNLGHEIVKSSIILYGVENYYNLISKWMNKE